MFAYNVNQDIKGGETKMTDDTKRLNVVISAELHRDLKVEAAKSGITLAQFVAEAIAEKIKRQQGSSD